jgi:drug/metabolite transporter (DMT)-like permease
MIVFATVIAFFLWNKGIHEIGASKSSIYMNFVPINAAWIAVLFYDSTITWQQVVGMMLVVIGVCISTFSKRSKNIKSKRPLSQQFP